jgi:hypothetical protein
MKNIFILIMVLLPISGLMAQEPVCGETANGISTDPNNPINDDCDGAFLNYFDWRDSLYYVPFYQGTTDSIIPSPFFEPNIAIREMHDPNDYLSARDFEIEDGWELITNGLTEVQSLTTTSKIAYLVLYNKYTAVLRVFGTHHDIGPNDYMAIYLNFDPSVNGDLSGLFHPTRQIAQPLDQKSISQVHANAKISGDNPLHFFYADFPMGYDPCTCILNRGSINVKFEAVDKQFLQIYGRSWAIDGTLADISSGKLQNSVDYLMNVYSDNQDNTQAGSLIFNSIAELETLYAQQKAVSSELNEQYQAVKNLKTFLDLASVAVFPNDSAYKAGVIPYLKFVSKFVDVLAMPLKKKADAASSAASSTGKIRIIQSEMTFSGGITNFTGKEGFTFRLPGRSGNSTECEAFYYPKYNEVLGRFALLETPAVEIGTSINVEQPPLETTVIQRFSFDKNSFKYMYNPAAKINTENSKIYAAIVVKKKNVNIPPSSGPSYSFFTNIDSISSLSNNDTTVYITQFVPIECLEEMGAELYFRGGVSASEFTPIYDVQLKLKILKKP